MDEKIINKERRKDLRVIIENPFTLKFKYKKGKNIFDLPFSKNALARNISAGGIRIELPLSEKSYVDSIKEGKDKIELVFKTPILRKPFKIIGTVSWLKKINNNGKDKYLAGVSFEGIKGKEREGIFNLLINMCMKDPCKIED